MNITLCSFKRSFVIILLTFLSNFVNGQNHTVARQWNEMLLKAIRNDFARPTVHARNFFHISAAMYDSWAVYTNYADTYFLGKSFKAFLIPFDKSKLVLPSDLRNSQEEALSYAVYRLINHRFRFSPGALTTLSLANDLMIELGYDPSYYSTDYKTESPAALGNYLANKIIEYGLQDGSNEIFDYRNQYYQPVNPPLNIEELGDQGLLDPNRWQPLAFETFIDQSGNEILGFTPGFLGAEWGNVVPFSLKEEDLSIYSKNNDTYKVYHDPGPPVFIDPMNNNLSKDYKWNFTLVSLWSSYLDKNNDLVLDISPKSIGNLKLEDYPVSLEDYQEFYKMEGGDNSIGYDLNPKTELPYDEQLVKRGDYARVLAEFWADGPDSETPPGHWFTLINYVNDQPELVKRLGGEGDLIDNFEWDIKSYFILGGAMHDSAVATWGIKGYYDYIRPISALRYMASKGQSSNVSLPNYSEAGLPLIEGFIEIIENGDALAGSTGENIGKVKVFTWKGPSYILVPETDEAGVGWVLGESWMPYQRPTFVTPPFAGYVSGHSTYSRAAAEVLSLLTGDEYFPGGMGQFPAIKDEFLVFEQGPSTDIVLQWAKYYDAADQCSLSRIWGGIHPPIDDIRGRIIGSKIGKAAMEHSLKYFNLENAPSPEDNQDIIIYPNPIKAGSSISILFLEEEDPLKSVELFSLDGKLIYTFNASDVSESESFLRFRAPLILTTGLYILRIEKKNQIIMEKLIITN